MIQERKASYAVRVYRADIQDTEWVGSFNFKRWGGKREAKEAAREAERAAKKRFGGKMTVDALVAAYVKDHAEHNKETSHRTVKVRLAYLTAKLGSRDVHSLTPLDALEWKRKVPAYCLPAATAVFNWANRKWITDKNPFASLSESSPGRSQDAPPTKAQFDALLDACSKLGEDYAPRFRALLRFAWGTGMRPGELFMLEWEPRVVTHKNKTALCNHVDFEAQTVHVNWRVSHGDIDIPKSNEVREIALTPPAAEALIGHPRDGLHVFQSKRGKRFSEATLSNYWAVVQAKADLEFDWYTATKHACVHYLWTELGVDEADIEKQMGWALGGAKELLKVYGHRDIGFRERIQAKYADNVRQLRAVSE